MLTRDPRPGRSRAGLEVLLLSGLCLASVPAAPVAGQEASLGIEENFRGEPNGTILGRLYSGTRVVVGSTEGNWSQVTLEGFVWLASLQARDPGDLGLAVAVPGGENLREEPAGRIGGRLEEGTLLEELERVPGWVRVRRTGWIWTPSLEVAAAPASEPATAEPPPDVPLAGAPAAIAGGQDWLRSSAGGGPILSAPDGDTLGTVGAGSEVRILAREGNWARVQLDGWVWVPSFSPDSVPEPNAAPVLEGIQVSDLSADFERLRGRLVEVDLQFISLERAEQVRTDFYEGEPFLLARSLDEDRSFVYVAIPPERLAEMGVLTPLERMRVLGRVRSGAAAFTGSPILDLVEIDRVR